MKYRKLQNVISRKEEKTAVINHDHSIETIH